MDVRNCKSCGKVFNYIGGQPLCPQCLKAMDDKFDDVKKYVYDHPGCGIQEVSEAMEVSVATIRRWLKEERLAFSEQSDIALNCENCGKRILTGRFCKECKNAMAHNLGNMYQTKVEEPKYERKKIENKMRFLEN